MRLAIMQPYFFPYLGYFQLINMVDKFIIYDDVNWINRGWINRNYALSNGKKVLITLNCKETSQNKKINSIKVGDNQGKLLKTISRNYRKTPFYSSVFPLIEQVITESDGALISEVASNAIFLISEYLKLKTVFETSSGYYADSISLKREKRLIDICLKNQADTYVNAIGGMQLYSKEQFEKFGIALKFIRSKAVSYNQFNHEFIPWLSIIDVMMFNDVGAVRDFLECYDLV